MLSFIWRFIARWRSWIFNSGLGILVTLGELLISLDTGFNWREILPPAYWPYVSLAILLVNLWMRPRPAVLASDPEVKVSKARALKGK